MAWYPVHLDPQRARRGDDLPRLVMNYRGAVMLAALARQFPGGNAQPFSGVTGRSSDADSRASNASGRGSHRPK